MEGHGGGPLLGVAWLKLGSQADVTSPLPPGGGWLLLEGESGGIAELVPSVKRGISPQFASSLALLAMTEVWCHCHFFIVIASPFLLSLRAKRGNPGKTKF